MLTDAKIKKLKAPSEQESEPSKHSDTHGLQLHIFRNGRMSWTYAYRFNPDPNAIYLELILT